ncbi:hypothetical protein Tco_0175135 [Tanacetum coccineum]
MPEPAPLFPEQALPKEEEEFEEEEEPQKEEEFEDEMDMDFDDEMDDLEDIYPYEVEADVLPPPPSSDSEPEDEIVPTGSFVASRRKVFAPGPLGKDANALHHKVKSLAQQLSIRAETEFSNLKSLCDVDQYMKEFDSDLRDEIQNRIKLERNMTTLEDQVRDLVYGEREENKKLKMVLESTRNDLARERPRNATTVSVAHLDPDDPYVSAATSIPIAREETPLLELRGSPCDSQYYSFNFDSFVYDMNIPLYEYSPKFPLCYDRIIPPRKMFAAAIERLVTDKVAKAIAVDCTTRVNAGGAGRSGGVGCQVRAPTVCECTFTRFMKCNPTVFYGIEGAVELCQWFKKTEMVFGISKCVEEKKVKFAAATLQGRALTWWNSHVATRGLEAANRTTWTKMKKLMTEEFYPA